MRSRNQDFQRPAADFVVGMRLEKAVMALRFTDWEESYRDASLVAHGSQLQFPEWTMCWQTDSVVAFEMLKLCYGFCVCVCADLCSIAVLCLVFLCRLKSCGKYVESLRVEAGRKT